LGTTGLYYADNIALAECDPLKAQMMMDKVAKCSKMVGLGNNPTENKVMSVSPQSPPSISLDGMSIEQPIEFAYLRSFMVSEWKSDQEIETYICLASASFVQHNKPLWIYRKTSITTKNRVYEAIVRNTLLYGCETWAVKAQNSSKLDIFDHDCLRRIIHVQLHKRVSNKKIHERFKHQYTVLDIAMRRARVWQGHFL